MNFIPQIKKYLQARHFNAVQPVAALIDMDGTLYDSMGNHASAWHRMVTELGIDMPRDEFYMYEGRTGAATLDIIFQRAYGRNATDEEKTELYHRKTVYFQELPDVNPMPGAQQMIDTLIKAGLRRVLVTGSGQSSLINRLDNDFPGAFTPQLRVTSRDVTKGKPHPEPFLRAKRFLPVISPAFSRICSVETLSLPITLTVLISKTGVKNTTTNIIIAARTVKKMHLLIFCSRILCSRRLR